MSCTGRKAVREREPDPRGQQALQGGVEPVHKAAEGHAADQRLL